MNKDCVLYPCETVEYSNCCIRDCGRYKVKKKLVFGEWCKLNTPFNELGETCNHPEYNGYCNISSCPIYKQFADRIKLTFCLDCKKKDLKIKQIKIADFNKELRFIATCPNCGKIIRDKNHPEINDMITCINCNSEFEICSTANFRDPSCRSDIDPLSLLESRE